MKYDYDYISVEKVEALLRIKGITDRQAAKMLWGDKVTNHRSLVKEVQKTDNMGIKRICHICETLDVSIDFFLQKSDKNRNYPTMNRKEDIDTIRDINTDINRLKAENNALKMVIEEKNLRIEDLKKLNENLWKRIDMLLQKGVL